MIIVFVIIIALARLKQKVTCDHFKYSTGERPDVSRCVVISTYDNLWRPILTSLDFRSKVMIRPTAVTHIAYLYHNVFINFRTSLTLTIVCGLSWLTPSTVILIIE